ncbi:MAG TPA: hypothetical protein VGI82_05700 [Chitinophagaceae bacterium]
MKTIAIVSIFTSLLLFACNQSDKNANEGKSDSDLDAARNFLDAALKGDFKTAVTYMLQDSANLSYLSMSERIYKGARSGEKDSLRTASLRFYETKQVNDSTTITLFSNSYKNKKNNLKLIRKNGQWLVDLKYLFQRDVDTAHYMQNSRIDTIHK